MSSNLTIRRTTRASSKKPQSNAPEHGSPAAENIINNVPTEPPQSATGETLAEVPRSTRPPAGMAKHMTRVTSKQPENRLIAPTAPEAVVTLNDRPRGLPGISNDQPAIGPPPPTVPSKRTRKRTAHRKSKKHKGNSALPNVSNAPPLTTEGTTRAMTSSPRHQKLPGRITPEVEKATSICAPDGSAPRDSAETTHLHPSARPSGGAKNRTPRASSKQPKANRSSNDKHASDKPLVGTSGPMKCTATTRVNHPSPVPEQSAVVSSNYTQPELKMTLATVSESENVAEGNSASKADPGPPPPFTTKRTGTATSKQPKQKVLRPSASKVERSLDNASRRSTMPVGPPPSEEKHQMRETSKQTGYKTLNSKPSKVQRSTSPTATPPTPTPVDSPTTMSPMLIPAPPHPDPYFNQPLTLIIPRTKPPPHATATALPSNAFSCSMCPSIVHGTANSLRHLRAHDILEVQCRLCDKEFHTSDSLKGHWMRHHAEKPRMWIIGELKSFYKDWSKSGVEKWCAEGMGVGAGEAMVKGKKTKEKVETRKGNTARAIAGNADSAVMAAEQEEPLPQKAAAVSAASNTFRTPGLSADVTALDDAADAVVTTAAEKQICVVVKHTPNVLEHPGEAMPKTTDIMNKKRKARHEATADNVNNKKHKPTAAANQATSKPQPRIAAKKATTRPASSKTKTSTKTNPPSVEDVKNVVPTDKPRDVPEKAVAYPTTEKNKAAVVEKKTTTNKVPAKKTANEITAPRMTRKRKADIENHTDAVNIKKPKTVTHNAAQDRLLMPPPVLPTNPKTTAMEANFDIKNAADPKLERRRILSEALSRFQVYMVPRPPLGNVVSDKIANENQRQGPEAGLREHDEQDEESGDSEDDLYSNPMLKKRIPTVQVEQRGHDNATAQAVFKQVLDVHLDAYVKQMSALDSETKILARRAGVSDI